MKTGETVNRILDQQVIWDKEYSKKGRLWGNVPYEPTSHHGEGIFLDLGCGDGKNLRRICPNINLTIGLDFSKEALFLCRSHPELKDVTFICADVKILPIQDNSVQFIDAHHIIGHLLRHDRIQVAHEISRILMPGGYLLVTVFGTEDFRNGTGIEVESGTFLKGTGIFTHYFSSDEFHSLFPNLHLSSQKAYSWSMRVRGKNYPRALWTVYFTKV